MNTIKDVLDKYGVDYRTRGKNIGRDFLGVSPCPECGDARYHFGISTKKPLARCFICGFNNLTKAISTLCSISYKKAKKIIDECYDLIIEEEETEETPKDETEFIKLYSSFGELEYQHRKYLENRRFDPDEIIRKYKVKGTDNISDWRYRIVIPIIMNNTISSFVARDITNKQEIRYFFCPDEKSLLPRRKLWYTVNSTKDSVILVEGIFDAWRFRRDCIALLSTQFTKEQVLMLMKRKLKNIFICLDSGERENKKAHELANILSIGCNHIEVIELEDGDPADLSDEDAQYLLKELGI